MTKTSKAMRHTAGALAILAAFGAGWTTPAVAGSGSFSSAVEQILMGQKEGIISTLPAAKKRAMVTCVNGVLTGMPNGMKRYVLAASDYGDMEARFGKVVMENHAEWKQKIAAGCSHIVV